MKRSEINGLLRWAEDLFKANNFALPPFAKWSPEEWAGKGTECDEIRHHMLGWDVTNFGRGDFEKYGLTLFTLRNGSTASSNTKPYAEKIMAIKEKQICPLHFHWNKMEDIINRGGGRLRIELYNAQEDDTVDESGTVNVSCDGVQMSIPAGGAVFLDPGESITLENKVYHRFLATPGNGPVLVGEVSTVNDDDHDNKFAQPAGRFPDIEEDVPPVHLLCNEYPDAE